MKKRQNDTTKIIKFSLVNFLQLIGNIKNITMLNNKEGDYYADGLEVTHYALFVVYFEKQSFCLCVPIYM